MQAYAEPRFRQRLPCQLRAGQSAFAGMVLNLSRGGLFVQTTAGVRPGQAVRLELSLGPHGAIPIEGRVVWRRVVASQLRTVMAGGFGLRIRSAPKPYLEYLEGLAQGDRTPPPSSAPPTAPARPSDAYRVRLQQQDGPRSRVLTVNAESEKDARRRALQIVGGTWVVVESHRSEEAGR